MIWIKCFYICYLIIRKYIIGTGSIADTIQKPEHALIISRIDWECARYTKPDKPLNARETLKKIYPEVTDEMLPVLEELGL